MNRLPHWLRSIIRYAVTLFGATVMHRAVDESAAETVKEFGCSAAEDRDQDDWQ